NDDKIVAIPLEYEDTITIGWLKQKQRTLSPLALTYLEMLQVHIKQYGFSIYPQE
ncbi:MAG TPA: LysR family transcriptional regulator, partial [Enterococcus faecalis]|nr:LysR family transcriptional regulator [Enterococcus faecalis]